MEYLIVLTMFVLFFGGMALIEALGDKDWILAIIFFCIVAGMVTLCTYKLGVLGIDSSSFRYRA